MSTNDELSRRLAATADAIEADPDLDAVVGRSFQKRTRRRRMAALGTAAVALVGVGALVVVANREPRATSDRPPVAASTIPTITPIDVTIPATVPATIPTATAAQPSTTEAALPRDLADPYLEQTTVVFDQVMGDDLRFVVRISGPSYGELFDIDWTARTGSIDECLGGPTLLSGDPAGERENYNEASRWDVFPLLPLSVARPTDVVQAASPFGFGPIADSITEVFVVRTQLPVVSLVVEGDGITSDLAEFVDGVAALQVTSEFVPVEPGSGTFTPQFDTATITLQPEPGVDVDQALLSLPLLDLDGLGALPPDCLPPSGHSTELPPPGQQPVDPAGAEAAIRERFALAVDTSIPFGDKPDDLFDFAEGLEQAIDDALAGPNGEYVRAARYEIVDLVFTSPDEAWFLYDLEALGVMYQPFGRAILVGDSWRISRDTICQDLARTGVLCDPAPSDQAVTPPSDPSNPPPAALTEEELAAYQEALACNPIRPCEDL